MNNVAAMRPHTILMPLRTFLDSYVKWKSPAFLQLEGMACAGKTLAPVCMHYKRAY